VRRIPPDTVDKLYFCSLPGIMPKLNTIHRRAIAVMKDAKATKAERDAAPAASVSVGVDTGQGEKLH